MKTRKSHKCELKRRYYAFWILKRHYNAFPKGVKGAEVDRSPRMREIGIRSPFETDLIR